MTDFFVSYSHEDQARAEWIAWQLKQNGHTVRIQAWNINPGNDWVHEMKAALQQCKRMIAVLSPDYLKSPYAQAEWNGFFVKDPSGTQRLIIPVRVAPTALDDLHETRNYIDFVGKDEATCLLDLLHGIDPHEPTVAPNFLVGQPAAASVRPAPAFPGLPPHNRADTSATRTAEPPLTPPPTKDRGRPPSRTGLKWLGLGGGAAVLVLLLVLPFFKPRLDNRWFTIQLGGEKLVIPHEADIKDGLECLHNEWQDGKLLVGEPGWEEIDQTRKANKCITGFKRAIVSGRFQASHPPSSISWIKNLTQLYVVAILLEESKDGRHQPLAERPFPHSMNGKITFKMGEKFDPIKNPERPLRIVLVIFTLDDNASRELKAANWLKTNLFQVELK